MNSLLSHLRIADLELLVTAMHLKNLTKAAQLHNLSQSAASAAVQRVEVAFGYSLCHHEKRHFRLTHEGILLVPRIEEWIRSFKEYVVFDQNVPLRLATTHAIANVILTDLIEKDVIDIQIMRPDRAYECVLKGEADIAIVTDNSSWNDVFYEDIGQGSFGLYSYLKDTDISPVLLPENQGEVLTFMNRWHKKFEYPVRVKARIPSWSLIADLCTCSKNVGFLPDFLAKKKGLFPMDWQPEISTFRILMLHRFLDVRFQKRFEVLVGILREIFL